MYEVPEASLVAGEHGLVAQGEGWFVVNARESRWFGSEELGKYVHFEGDARFDELGINITVVQPGQPSCMYHGENAQEGFLVLAGEGLLLIEGEERPLRAWDFVHCPPWTSHVIVGAGTGLCVFLAVGARPKDNEVRYEAAEVARRHDAAVAEDTSSPAEAYARFSDDGERLYQNGYLPDL